MKRITHTTILALLVLATALAAHSDQMDGRAALKKMFEAESKVSYIAHEVTTLARGPAMTSEQTVYKAGDKGMRMEYTSPDGLKGEIRADDGHVLAHYIPEKKVLRMRQSRLASAHSWMAHADRMFGRVDVEMVGRDKMAGRSAYVVEIKPHSGRGPSRKIWIDTEKWIKLKTEEIGPDGTVLSMSYFTKIDFVGSISGQKFHVDAPPGVRVEHEEHEPHTVPIERAKHEAGFQVLVPSYLPQGFKSEGAAVIPFRDGKIVAIRYTDGVSMFSLFQTPGERLNPRFIERLHHGPDRAGMEVFTWRVGDISFTIVGQISQDEIRRIARSVKQ